MRLYGSSVFFQILAPCALLACSSETGDGQPGGVVAGGAAGAPGMSHGGSSMMSAGGSGIGGVASGGKAAGAAGRTTAGASGAPAGGGPSSAGRGGSAGARATGGDAGEGIGASAGRTAEGGAGGRSNGGSAGASEIAGAGSGGKTAGASGRGGGAGTSGAAGTGGGKCQAPVAGTSMRPQLSDADAQKYTIATYLARTGPFTSLTTDNWDPTPGLGDASAFTADFTVAADGSGTHTTLAAALSAVSGSTRRYVRVKPGTYRGQVAYSGSTPVTLYGVDTDATQVVIINNKSQQDGTSETLGVKSAGFQLMNLTLSNDFPTPASGSDLQALALKTTGDKIVLQNVRLHGFQDTIQMAATNATTVSRVYIKDSFIEGDTDFIYGSATVVLDNVTVHYLSSRRGTSSGVVMAPSTSVDNQLGFLFIRCTFTADEGAPSNRIFLGRSWDTSSTTPTPNGQGVIRDSTLGAYVDRDSPWTAAATSGRAYSASGNRFYEYCNAGPGAAP